MGKNSSSTTSNTNSYTDDLTNTNMNSKTKSNTNSITNSTSNSNTVSNGLSNTHGMSSTTPTFTNASMINPYYNTTTDENGNVTSSFVKGSAGDTAYNFVNQNISGLLDNYLNPTLDSATNQAKMDLFNKQQQTNLQNNIINPLLNNNMIRSSQATNMYNNLSDQAADYGKELIANSQSDTWDMINNLVNLYSMGYNGSASDAAQLLQAALGSQSVQDSSTSDSSTSNTASNSTSNTSSSTTSDTSSTSKSKSKSDTKTGTRSKTK